MRREINVEILKPKEWNVFQGKQDLPTKIFVLLGICTYNKLKREK